MITIYGHLDGLNEYTKACRGNRYAGASMKKRNEKKIKEAIYEALENAEVSPVNDSDYPLHVIITWYDDTRRDLDNVVFGKKFIFDALTECEIIKDDSRKYICAVSEKVIKEKQNPRIDISLEKAR